MRSLQIGLFTVLAAGALLAGCAAGGDAGPRSTTAHASAASPAVYAAPPNRSFR